MLDVFSLAQSVAVTSGLGHGGEDRKGRGNMLLASGITGELCLFCGCLELTPSLMGPFCGWLRDIPSPISGDFLPPGSLMWLPHSLLSWSLENPLVHLYSCLLGSIAVQEVALIRQARYSPILVLMSG